MYPDGVPEFAPEPPFKTLAGFGWPKLRRPSASGPRIPSSCQRHVRQSSFCASSMRCRTSSAQSICAKSWVETKATALSLQSANSLPICRGFWRVQSGAAILVNIQSALIRAEEMGKQFQGCRPQALNRPWDMFTDKLAEAAANPTRSPISNRPRVARVNDRALCGQRFQRSRKLLDQTIKARFSQPHVRLPGTAEPAARKRIKAEGIDPASYDGTLDRSGCGCLQYTGARTGRSARARIPTQGKSGDDHVQTNDLDGQPREEGRGGRFDRDLRPITSLPSP